MKYTHELSLARIFMGKKCGGEHECVCCGLSDRAAYALSKKLLPTFTNLDEIMLGTGTHICESCVGLLEDKDMRFKPVFFEEMGKKEIPERQDVLEIIKHPKEWFVLSVPYSFKKHHWLFAGISNTKLALIGTDTRTVAIDYTAYDVKAVVGTVEHLIQCGVPRNEIVLGKYSTFTRYKMPNIDDYEKQIGGMRSCGAIELFVKYTPAVTQKIKLPKMEDDSMLAKSEMYAMEILSNIAKESKFRQNDGIRFWGGFFERRINRLKSLELHEFVSALCDAVGAGLIYTEKILDMTQDEEKAVMDEIRNKANLLVSLAYGAIKKRSEQ